MKTATKTFAASLSALLLASMASATALADHGRMYGHDRRDNTQYVDARVVDVKPLIRTVRVETPIRECYDRPVRHETRRRGDAGRTIAGGIIGGIIGRQFGDGRGRDAMTVLGTVVGAAAASDGRRSEPEYYETTEEICETRYEIEERERVDGFRVTYRYAGQLYTTRTKTDPGDRIRVRVSVEPLVR